MDKKNTKEKKKFSFLKLFRNLLITFVVLLALVYLLVIFATGPIIKSVAGKYAPQIIGAPLQIGSVSVSPLLNRVTVEGISLGNVEGMKSEESFKLKSFTASISLLSLLTDEITIHEVIIDGVEVTYEHDSSTLSQSNFTKMKDNAMLYIGNDGTDVAEIEKVEEVVVEDDQPSTGPKLVVELFQFKNARVTFANNISSSLSVPIPLPDVELVDIGKADENGASISDVFEEIMSAVLGSVNKAGSFLKLDKAGELISDVTGKTVDLLGDAGKGLGEGVLDVGDSLGDGLEDVGDAIGEGAKATGDALKKGANAILDLF